MEETAPNVGTVSYEPPAPFATTTTATAAPDPLLVETSPPPIGSPSSSAGDGGSSSKPAKAARTEKAYKGLRHFSMMVCKKVEEKGTTSYNEVADELVQSVVEQRRQQNPNANYDEKNIRRRVYDALNVLMAMDIITKEKKEITWKGLPTEATQDLEMLQRELDFRKHEVQKKRDTLMELLVQQVCFRNLLAHNQKRELEQATANVAAAGAAAGGGGAAGGAAAAAAAAAAAGPPIQDNKIPLPFIVVNTHSSAVIQCNMSRDLTDVKFDFSSPFEINDDNTILKRLGM